MKRSKHSLSHYQLTTFDMGQLIPVGHFEVLPGDSVRMTTSALLRASPLLAPVMHPVQVRLHHWFVPYRQLWTGFEDFITGVAPGTFPAFTTDGTSTVTSLDTYLGVPHGISGLSCSLFPRRAYNLIYNENYRDQDLVAEVAQDSAVVHKVAWEKDYFTAARPWTQKGGQVTVPIVGNAPIKTAAAFNQDVSVQDTSNNPYKLGSSLNFVQMTGNTGTAGNALYADLGQATATDINAIRRAFALQRYAEARAQYGSRYTEYLRYLGIRSSDARLQRPEYLGGGRATVQFSEVLRTGDYSGAPAGTVVGQMKGHGVSAIASRRWVRFFEEHGIVMTLASMRPRSIYVNGLHRSYAKRTKEDYWQKELELIGQQPILNQEVYAGAASKLGTFGYQDRYSEYRHEPSIVTGEFRDTLDFWHMGRKFGSEPALNESFITCDPTKRIHAVTSANTMWAMFNHNIQARRLVGHKTIGRVI